MTARQSAEGGRIVIGQLLRADTGCCEQMPRHHGSAGCDGHAVEEVTARDVASHSQFAVVPVAQKASELKSVLVVRKGLMSDATQTLKEGFLRLAIGLFDCQFRAL